MKNIKNNYSKEDGRSGFSWDLLICLRHQNLKMKLIPLCFDISAVNKNIDDTESRQIVTIVIIENSFRMCYTSVLWLYYDTRLSNSQ